MSSVPVRRPRRVARRSSLSLVAAAIAAIGLVVGSLSVTLAADPGGGQGRSIPAASAAVTPRPEPTPSPVATPAGPVALGPTVTFYGRGWGHGVGLSQYGARGRALAGQTSAEILAHYYEGTLPGQIDPATTIRILVMTGYVPTDAAPLVVVGREGPWQIDGIDESFPTDARVSLRLPAGGTTAWRLTITGPDSTVLRDSTVDGPFVVRPVGPDVATDPAPPIGHLELPTKPSAYDEYRGILRVIPASNQVRVVNEVAIDDYLRGVVPAEMPSGWPAPALEAQAVAARSYAAYRLRPETGDYDTVDDTRSQVYRGVLAERSPADAAVLATSGAVLRAGSSIANALFHSTGGGATEDNENVFVSASGNKVAGPVSYLRGSSDRMPDGVAYDASSPYATWQTATYTLAEVSAWFAADSRTNVGSLTALDLGDRGVSGRLISVTLIGSGGTKRISGDVFRSVFEAGRPAGSPSLRSTLFDLVPIP